MTQPVLVRQSTAVTARRLRRDADAYDELLLRRLAERGEPPGDFAVDGELPGVDEVLLDTALHHAAAERARQRACSYAANASQWLRSWRSPSC